MIESASRNATHEIIDIPLYELGISIPHLVRPIVEEDVDHLAETDEAEWEPIEIRVWPEDWERSSALVRYHVISGNHRTSAARKKNLSTLKTRVLEAPDDLSYTVAAVKSNTRHGKNFTQEQRLALAQKLSEQGLSLAEIAKTFGVHKSTVGNWLSGRDSNASKKRLPEPVAYATTEQQQQSPNDVSPKLLGWLAIAPIQISPEDARLALLAMPPGLQEKARTIQSWLVDVLEVAEC